MLPDAAALPFLRKLVANGDATHALVDPGVGVTLGLVDLTGALHREPGFSISLMRS